MGDQCKVTLALLEPEAAKAEGGLYMVRGTEAHVGISAQTEEAMARALGAVPNDDSNTADGIYGSRSATGSW